MDEKTYKDEIKVIEENIRNLEKRAQRKLMIEYGKEPY